MSKKVISFSDITSVNLMLGWNLLAYLINCSLREVSLSAIILPPTPPLLYRCPKGRIYINISFAYNCGTVFVCLACYVGFLFLCSICVQARYTHPLTLKLCYGLSQPRPQGAFPWLWVVPVAHKAREKRPGDEVGA